MREEDPDRVSEDVNERAAKVIQRTWRRHMNVSVFKYLKNLVGFRHQGDPRLLLRCVNPVEANMLDAAAGVLIRFRLGGTSFPPKLYYKIFTHRPIVDLCASSPKDYTHPGQRRPLPEQIHNKRAPILDDSRGWYRRVENNGWRSLCVQVGAGGDAVAEGTSSKTTEFHHCGLVRRRDVERKKKMRKIQWMRKMYNEGVRHAQTEHKETTPLLESATRGLIHTAERPGPGGGFDWEVDELIEWTNGLDFEEYVKEWKDLAVSNSSAPPMKDKQLDFSDPHPFMMESRGEEIFNISAPSAHVSNLIKSQYHKSSSQ